MKIRITILTENNLERSSELTEEKVKKAWQAIFDLITLPVVADDKCHVETVEFIDNDVENVAYHYKDRIAGYEIRDLVLVTETLRKHNIKPQDLRLRGDAYMKGWKDCERYHDEIMQQVVSNMKDHMNAFAEGGEKP